MTDEFPPIPDAVEDIPLATATVAGGSPASGDDAFTWQKNRARPDKLGGPPIRGFGPGGTYTLWLPSPVPTVVEEFVKGKFQRRMTDATEFDPDLWALRRQVIKSAAEDEDGVLRVDYDFYNYAAALILRNYKVTDSELHMLLRSGTGWHNGVMQHLIGGEDQADALAELPGAVQSDPHWFLRPIPRAGPAPIPPRGLSWLIGAAIALASLAAGGALGWFLR